MAIAVADADIVRWSDPAFARIAQLAATRAGLTFPETRREVAESAMRRAMAHAGEKTAADFAHRVAHEPEAYAAAITELTVGETYFFRDPAQWDLIRSEIVPELLRTHPDGRGVRAWSAGCASGEEAYTLGIVLREFGCVSPTVAGTDLCEHRLARAARAVYTKWSMRGMDEAARRRYFRENGQYFHLLPEHRDVQFRFLNLAGLEYGVAGHELSGLDLILCRNVLIYIDPEVCASIFARLTDALREGGWLMLSASDPQPASDLPLDVVLTDAGLLYRKNTTRTRQAPPPATAMAAPTATNRARTAGPPAGSDRASPAARRGAVAPAHPVAHEKRARHAYRVGNYDEAIAVAQAALDTGRGTASTWVLLARAHANRGDLAGAARACAEGLARLPDTAELHVVASALESQLEQFAASAEAARRALYVDRSLAVAHVALGTALLRLGDAAAADRALRAAERALAVLDAREIVPASDGVLALDLLSAVRAHRAMLAARVSHVG